MNSKFLKDHPILRPIIELNLQDLTNGSFEMVDQVITVDQKNQLLQLSFIEKFIVIYAIDTQKKQISQAGTYPLAFIDLDASITFQKIFSKNQVSKQSKCSGLKFTDQLNNHIQFYLQKTENIDTWITKLSSIINQTGFHQFYKPFRKLTSNNSSAIYQIIRIQDGARLIAKVFSKYIFQNNNKKFLSFKSEVKLLRIIDSECLVKLEAVYETNSSYYLVMQKVKGGNLYDYLATRKQSFFIMDVQLLMRKLLNMLQILQEYQIVHGDIKLENIMLRDRNRLDDIVLINFGMAVSSNYQYTQCQGKNPGYLASETLPHQKQLRYSYSSDMFSVGAIFHAIMKQKYILQGQTQKSKQHNNKDLKVGSQLRSNLDRQAMDLMQKMLKADEKQQWTATQCLKHKFFSQQFLNVDQQPLTNDQSLSLISYDFS